MLGYGSDVSPVGKFLLTLICILMTLCNIHPILNTPLWMSSFPFFLDFLHCPHKTCIVAALWPLVFTSGGVTRTPGSGKFLVFSSTAQMYPRDGCHALCWGNSTFQSHQSQDSSHLTSDISSVDIYIWTSFMAIREWQTLLIHFTAVY